MDNRTDAGLPRPVSDGKPEPLVPPPDDQDEPIPSEFGVDEPEPQEPEEPETDEPELEPDAEKPADEAPAAPEPAPPAMPADTPTPAAAQPAPGETAPKSGCPWGWVLACGLGCGALVVAIIAALLAFAFMAGQSEDQDTEPATTIESSTDPAQGAVETPPSDQGATDKLPEVFRPGEQVALEAAMVDYPDWVGKVQSHSADWTEAVVWIGPPQSEFVWEYKLCWNADGTYYDILSVYPVEPVGGY